MRDILTRFNKPRLYIGKKTVNVEKITITKSKRLTEAIGNLPMLILDILRAPETDRLAYIVVSVERSLDDFVRITSVLSGLDEEYIEEYASLDQIVEYLTQMYRYNDFNSIVKNVQSVLIGNVEAPTQDAK